ncbi:MAG: hypothetical protein JXR48_09120 [Candidatus Delongbacteria bacterium]|nr:hypothetical protein [Candidatus Delongbacteria bacterium]MBN2835112.1 hypothetical protein [Candidatus Delongbacteria bacterium]
MIDIEKLFEKMPVDDETIYENSLFITKNGLNMKFEEWAWSNYKGKSLIFIESEIEDLAVEITNSNMKELAEKVLDMKIDDPVTLKVNAGFVFFNFNFEII